MVGIKYPFKCDVLKSLMSTQSIYYIYIYIYIYIYAQIDHTSCRQTHHMLCVIIKFMSCLKPQKTFLFKVKF